MRFLKISEINIKDKKEIFYIKSDSEDKELELNEGFFILKNILDYIYFMSTAKKMQIYIEYFNEILSYYIALDDKDSTELIINSKISNCIICETHKTKELELKEYTYLYGSANPMVLNSLDENLLDEIIYSMGNNNFTIKISLEKCENELEYKKSDLRSDILRYSKLMQKQISEQENMGKKMWQSLTGGTNEGYSSIDIEANYKVELLKDEYNHLSSHCTNYKTPIIKIAAEKKNIVDSISSKIIAFSERSGLSTAFKVRSEKKEVISPSSFIAALFAVPVSKVPGIKVNKYIDYSSDVIEVDNGKKYVNLGKLQKRNNTNIDIKFSLDNLTKHAFITGVTGSGKTTTIKKILLEAYDMGIPFLVMEPAKSEYRNLSNYNYNIKRYVLGIEGPNSFKMNPFEFPEGIHIQTHLDYLKSVFIAAFPMYGPMPYILETAFYNIYRKTGWDLISSENIYKSKLERKYLFPILDDLFNAIEEVTDSVGYSDQLKNDVKGALKVRVGSLMAGAKGIMLNTYDSEGLSSLISMPSIIELENIGDPQEKVFLMGLILTKIYEHYISLNKYNKNLSNILVIEEAHRLLENVAASNNNEVADMKGKAVEVFNNILSEIRAYGQGIIISDQIPTKISRDVIKNTNLKICHRLFAKDDRELIGNSIGLSEEQIKGLLNIKPGEGVLFHSDISDPVKVIIQANEHIISNNTMEDRITSPELSLSKVALTNPKIVKEGIKLLNTYMLFQQSEASLLSRMRNLIAKYYEHLVEEKTQDEIYQETIEILKGITKFFVKEKIRLGGLDINHYQETKLIQEALSEDNPLRKIVDYFNSYKTKEKGVLELSRISSIFKVVYPFTDELLYKLYPIYLKYKDRFNENNESLSNEVLSTCRIGEFFDLNILGSNQRKELSDCMVLYSLKDQDKVLHEFFNIVDMSEEYEDVQVRGLKDNNQTQTSKGLDSIDSENMKNNLQSMEISLKKLVNVLEERKKSLSNNDYWKRNSIVLLSVNMILVILILFILLTI